MLRTTSKVFLLPAPLVLLVKSSPHKHHPAVRLASLHEDNMLLVSCIGSGSSESIVEAGALIITHLRVRDRIVAEFLALLSAHSGAIAD